MKKPSMMVKSVEGRMEPNYEAMDARSMRFVGYKHDAKAGGFVLIDEPVEVPVRAEYMQAIRRGSLLPVCDKAKQYARGK
jgi:hypothetical protein